jgi:hypothetical protein
MHAIASTVNTLPAPDALDEDLGIELLDDMVEEDFWDGFVVGASLGAAAAGGAIAIGIAT